MDQSLQEANQRIEKALEHLRMELASIRAGRANPSLVENIPVDAYGGKMKLVEVAGILAPQPTLLTVQIWDASLLDAVVKAIQESGLGLNPASDGQLIRLPIPPLTQERRTEFVKLLHQKTEEARVEIRQIRQDLRQEWIRAKEAGDFGEDELFRREKLLQDLIDKNIVEIENMSKVKEEELRQV